MSAKIAPKIQILEWLCYGACSDIVSEHKETFDLAFSREKEGDESGRHYYKFLFFILYFPPKGKETRRQEKVGGFFSVHAGEHRAASLIWLQRGQLGPI